MCCMSLIPLQTENRDDEVAEEEAEEAVELVSCD